MKAFLQSQGVDDGVHSNVLLGAGVSVWVQTEVGTEQQVLSHRESAHDDVILEEGGGGGREGDRERREGEGHVRGRRVMGLGHVIGSCDPSPAPRRLT